MPEALTAAALFVASLCAMEGVAYLMHKYVMHGWLWRWHRSHHAPRHGAFERNDLFAVCFAVPSIALIWTGVHGGVPALLWVGLGMTGYGVVYALFHDALVHHRFPWKPAARGRILKRLVQAHRIHHAVHTKDGAVSFGFLWAPPVRKLRAELRVLHGDKVEAA